MSKIKSFSVGDGDMFYINHNSDNFTIIDCYLSDENKERIVDDIIDEQFGKGITRFISTHPDEDHFLGLKYLNDRTSIINFYCVKNQTTKEDETSDFKHYRELRDSSKVFHIEKDCSRKWMNRKSDERGASGINILWPIVDNSHYKEALKVAEEGGSPNNISAIIQYSLSDGVTALWMGDLETDFMEKIKDEINWPKVHILFAPHHGRDTGKIPEDILSKMEPKIIVIGEAPAENLNYYINYNTITQNSAEDITFECGEKKVHIFVSNPDYSVDFLDDENMSGDDNYIGTLNL
jgi:beta-lactamase superfamily II metal-dependent hydrolase